MKELYELALVVCYWINIQANQCKMNNPHTHNFSDIGALLTEVLTYIRICIYIVFIYTDIAGCGTFENFSC